MNYIIRLFFVLLLIFEFGCETANQGKSPSLSMDDFADIYVHAIILSQNSDSLKTRSRLDSLLKVHAVSLAEMQQTVMSYEQDQEKWRLFWALVVKKLEDKSSAVAKSDTVVKPVQ